MIYIRLFEDRDKYDNSTLYYPSVSYIKNENKLMYGVFKIVAKYVLEEDVPQGESAFYLNRINGSCGSPDQIFIRNFDSFKVNGIETVVSKPIEDLGTYTPIATEINENMDGPLFTPESLITGASLLHITFSKKPELIGLYIDGVGNVTGDFDMWADIGGLTVISDTEYFMDMSTLSGLLGVDYESLIVTAYGSDGSMTIDDINSFNTSIKATVGGDSSDGSTKGWKAGEYEVVMVPSKTCNLFSLFENIDSLKELYLYGDFSIFNLASFVRDTNISKIKFHNTRIKTIANSMFSSCSGLTSVTIPDSVTSISDYAFSGCRVLSSIVIPDSVTSISDYAFSGCKSLSEITIPDSVTSIGTKAFYGCLFQHDNSINNSSATGYPWGATLYDVIQEDGLCISGTTATDCRPNATNVIIPDGVTSIGDWAFSERYNLTSITIPDSVTSIGGWAFNGCSSLTSIIIPSGVTSISGYAFNGCKSLSEITIPDSVTSIGNNAFNSCSGLTSIIIPSGVTSIGACAFQYCTSLSEITIPDRVTSISDDAFFKCLFQRDKFINNSSATGYPWDATLYDVIQEDGLCINGTTAADCRPNATNVIIPDGVTSIGYRAFYECYNLTSITIPDSVTSIGGWAFFSCYNLTSITIPSGVTSISDNAFRYCTSLTSVIIPSGVTSISDHAFRYCTSLTSITIPDSVTSIGDGAFGVCRSLTSIIIPSGVTSIGNDAFSECYSLTSVTIPDSVTSISNYAFNGCSGLTSVTIGNGVTSIGNYAFNGCSGLTSVTIGNGVTSIGDGAFQYCTSLTSIIIPSGVTSIGSWAFEYCTSLNEITCLATTAPTLGYYASGSLSTNGILYVPNGSDYSTWLSNLPSGWTIEYI